jgi:hypothetical protein
MAEQAPPRMMPLVLIAGVVTLILSVVRVYGELQAWDPRWFPTGAGGGMTPVAIVWLVPVFGFLFGRRLARLGSRPPFVSAFFVPMFGLAALVAALVYVSKNHTTPEELRGMMRYVVYGAPVLAVLALFAWPRAFVTNLGYGLLARIPVAIITWLDIKNDWSTHYGEVAPGLPPMVADEKLQMLLMAQAALWLPFTLLAGGAAAAIGAATVRRA